MRMIKIIIEFYFDSFNKLNILIKQPFVSFYMDYFK